jgi:hypothetical protein
MHEATDDGRRELSPSHAAKVAQCCHIDRSKLRYGCVNACGEDAQNGLDVRFEKVVTFRLNRGDLLWRQRVPAGVGEKAIDDAGNMSHMKGRGRHACRASVPFLLR